MLVALDGSLNTYRDQETDTNRKKVQEELTYALNGSMGRVDV